MQNGAKSISSDTVDGATVGAVIARVIVKQRIYTISCIKTIFAARCTNTLATVISVCLSLFVTVTLVVYANTAKSNVSTRKCRKFRLPCFVGNPVQLAIYNSEPDEQN